MTIVPPEVTVGAPYWVTSVKQDSFDSDIVEFRLVLERGPGRSPCDFELPRAHPLTAVLLAAFRAVHIVWFESSGECHARPGPWAE